MDRILSVGDCTPHLLGIAKAAMAAGANHHEALNLIRSTLDNLAAHPERYFAPKQQLPEGYETALAEAFGTRCGEDGDLEARGT
jgi:hypothetical protein